MIVVVWTGENDTKTISVDANLFENGARQLRFRLKRSGQGLNLAVNQKALNCQTIPEGMREYREICADKDLLSSVKKAAKEYNKEH